MKEKKSISKIAAIELFVKFLHEGRDKNFLFSYYFKNFQEKTVRTLDNYYSEARMIYEKERAIINAEKLTELKKKELKETQSGILQRDEILKLLSEIGTGQIREVHDELIIPSDSERIRALSSISEMQGYNIPENEEDDFTLIKKNLTLRDAIIDKHYRFFEKKDNILISEGGSRSGKTANFVRWAILQNTFDKYDLNIIAPSYKMLNLGSFIDAKEFIEEYNIDCKLPVNATQIKFPTGGTITFEVVISENEAKRNRNNVFMNEADGIPEEVANLIIGRARGKTFIDYNPTRKFWAENYKTETNVQISDFRDNPFLSQSQKEWFYRLLKGKDAEIGSPERYAYDVYYLGVFSALGKNAFRGEDFKFYENVPESFDVIMSYADPSLGVGADYFAAGLFGIKDRQVYLLDAVFSQYESAETYHKKMLVWDNLFHGIEHFFETNGIGKLVFNKIRNNYNGIFHAVSNQDSKGGDIILYSPEVKLSLYPKTKIVNEIIAQCVSFPNANHDDAPDMLARAHKIIYRLFIN